MIPFPETFSKIAPVLPADWPGWKLHWMPGDLSRFVPQGFGLGAPMVFMPWENLESMKKKAEWYGFDTVQHHPILGAPTTSPSGGTVYFEGHIDQQTLHHLLLAMGINVAEVEFGVFAASSTSVKSDHYLDQIRLITVSALRSLFKVPSEIEVPHASIRLETVVWRFLEIERERWGFHKLTGVFGGDGDWAKERLAFGFMVENTYWGVYRLWSRPWLATK